ncbi:pyridoxamine 5'-phosphate oxidase family protein [Piscinibacter gummiphilus]|uniref:Pyridoxamine 5'-phosphate oxidase family protein n=1 Tax=Piscinibacter gummiphilus TaxID=946333 RepID=A0ABZ0D1U2_9BURK|nr:pyridoxamine 5'-phosphate oxidase family protein [Piscinibacter gummiphilus]WOB09028.1 pyridoxamine 5'-phosphate oxidase family protein [Piscinibacter gummiphilus]
MRHAGETTVQRRLGVDERMGEVMEQVVRTWMPEQHRELFGKLPTLLVGSLDAHGRPWASMLHGAPGFIRAPDERHLHIAARPSPDDPWQPALDTPIGLLGLEPHTRRRNRMNGSVVALDADGFTIEVDQSFGNCPKYIQARTPYTVHRTPAAPRAEGPLLGDTALELVRHADTLFIATASHTPRAHAGAEGVDVSHRGGPPGFVHVGTHEGRTVLTIPDYPGNRFFNTLGNLVVNPRAGLLFVDYHAGHLLQLTGDAHLLWEGELRAIRITVQNGWWRAHALPLRWSPPEPAPQFTGEG